MNIYFSENIKSFRKQRNLTQEGLADLLGVTFQAVSKWERGESFPDITLLPVIADFFDVSIDDLLGVDKAK
ncbi:MAG: helix-turn-helix domain-containing protein, partial [Eubacterium sp.]|nr:helix-turn-helix domain-containing protein [Eubacterium sp.]